MKLSDQAVKTMERRIQSRFTYRGFGFPLLLRQVPMVRVRGTWTPDVNYNALAIRVLRAIAMKPARLIGAEIRLIRDFFSMTLQKFARRFGVTHPAVLKWEGAGTRTTSMSWAIEKDIRLEVLRRVSRPKGSSFLRAYEELMEIPPSRHEPLRIIGWQPA